MITEIAAASAELLRLLNNVANRSLLERIDQAKAHATRDVESFKTALLDCSLDRVNLLLGGLQHGILVRLAESESRELRALRPNLDGAALLALYARGRAADLAAECAALAQQSALSRDADSTR